MPGILSIKHPGYHQARTFYTPNYNKVDDTSKPDFRTTLYWNPMLQLKGKEPAPFSFYTGDKLSEFLIFVEGITGEGIPFVEQKEIQISGNVE